jgi:hypothetical protein
MKRVILLVALLTGVAHADTAMDRALGGIERGVDEARVRELGRDADRQLIRVATDPAISRLRRARAIYALGVVPSVLARDFLLAVLDEKSQAIEGADVADTAAAIDALAPYGAQVLGRITVLVTHKSADVRQATVSFFARTKLAEGNAILRARAVVETDVGVRRAIARALAKRD